MLIFVRRKELISKGAMSKCPERFMSGQDRHHLEMTVIKISPICSALQRMV